jgi:ubiquinone/menaquinone biosynthesis C-methylase UbiE
MDPFFDMIADIYDETRGLPKDTMDEITNILADEIGNKKVLDIGVGTGRFAFPLQRKGIDVVGVDLSRSMMKRARKKGMWNLVFGEACELPFSDLSFDFVLSVHLLHLVEDSGAVLREIKRIGKEGLISILFKRSEFNALEEYKRALSFYSYPLTVPGFREHELKRLVKPVKTIPVSPFESLLPIKERINLLENRKHSYSLETPEEIHNDAIRFLKKKHENQVDKHAEVEVEIAFWNIPDLPDSVV